MPKNLNISSWLAANGGDDVWVYEEGTRMLTCRLCNYQNRVVQLFPIMRHTERQCHIKKYEAFLKNSVKSESSNMDLSSDFTSDLTKMFVSCNVPISIVEYNNFSLFIQKYTGRSLPSRYAITQSLKVESESMLSKISDEIDGRDIFMTLDETTDIKDRSLIAVLIGPLDETFSGTPYLINLCNVVNANCSTIQEVAVTSLLRALGSNFRKERLKVFLTNEAPYSILAANVLKRQFPMMIHVTCLNSGFNRIAELCRTQYPTANLLISEMKKVLSGTRKGGFTTMCQIPLPPDATTKPLITWLKTVHYYVENFTIIKGFVNALHENNSSINILKEILNNENTFSEMFTIHQNCTLIPDAISALEERIPLIHSVSIVENLKKQMELEPLKSALIEIIEKNLGYIQLRKIATEIRNIDDTEESNFCNYKNVPIVNYDADNVFNMVKDVNTPKRTNLSSKHFKEVLLIKWNSEILKF